MAHRLPVLCCWTSSSSPVHLKSPETPGHPWLRGVSASPKAANQSLLNFQAGPRAQLSDPHGTSLSREGVGKARRQETASPAGAPGENYAAIKDAGQEDHGSRGKEKGLRWQLK